jgi:hypothetical protein
MSLSGGDMGDMGDRLSDADIESLISGSKEVDTSLGELINEMREYADWRPDPSQQANHIVGAMAAVQVTVNGAVGVVNDLSSPGVTRRQEMIGRIMATRTARVLAAALATLLATSGIAWAATGSDPVSQVSSVVEQVGQVFNSDTDDDQVEETDVNDTDDDHSAVVDDTKDDSQVDDSVADDVDDSQVDETDVEDTDDDHSAVVDDSKDDELEETDVEDTEDDHASVTEDKTSEDDHVKETDHEDDHSTDHESDQERDD